MEEKFMKLRDLALVMAVEGDEKTRLELFILISKLSMEIQIDQKSQRR
jgi:hypothetical protein